MGKKKKEQNQDEELLLRHEAFIEAYLRCLNGTQAYLELHPGANANVAGVEAFRLLRLPKIKAEIERRFGELTMGKKEVLARLKAVANATLFPFIRVEDSGHILFNFKDPEAKRHLYLVKKIKSKRDEHYDKDGDIDSAEQWIEVELHDALKAIELIGKYHALFTDKTEHTEKKVIKVTIGKPDD